MLKQVDITTLQVISFRSGENGPQGSFINAGEGQWIELDHENKPRFAFEQTAVSSSTITIIDRKRNYTLDLDLSRKEILTHSGSTASYLYTITNTVTGVSGWRLAAVDFAQGRFEQTGADLWEEHDATGKTRFHFTETGRSGTAVSLVDKTRNISLVIDLVSESIKFVRSESQDVLYPIIATHAGPLNSRKRSSFDPPQALIKLLVAQAPRLLTANGYDAVKAAAKAKRYNEDTNQAVAAFAQSDPFQQLANSNAHTQHAKPIIGNNQHAIRNLNFPRSLTLNFGGGGSFILGAQVAQGITFDFHPAFNNSGGKRYSGTTTIGGSIGAGGGVEVGAFVSLNWYTAKNAGGWFGGASGSIVDVGGVTLELLETTSGGSIVVGIVGGLDVGASASGGYSIYEGEGYYL